MTAIIRIILSFILLSLTSCNTKIKQKNDFDFVYILEATNEGKKDSIGTCFYSNSIFYTNVHLIIYKDLTGYNLYENIIARDQINNVKYELEVISYDLTNDYAELKSDIPINGGLDIVKNYNFEIGEDIFTIGNLNDYGLAYGYGKITSYKKKINNLDNDISYIQTNIEISGGNSGGPIFNVKNEVIGIMALKLVSNNEYVDGASFFILIK